MESKPNQVFKDRSNILSVVELRPPKENLMYSSKEKGERRRKNRRWFGFSLPVISAVRLKVWEGVPSRVEACLLIAGRGSRARRHLAGGGIEKSLFISETTGHQVPYGCFHAVNSLNSRYSSIQMSKQLNFQSQTRILFGSPMVSVSSVSFDDSEGMHVLK